MLSGTGGPLVLVPILTFLSMPLLAVIGLSQAIQIPIAVFATIESMVRNNSVGNCGSFITRSGFGDISWCESLRAFAS